MKNERVRGKKKGGRVSDRGNEEREKEEGGRRMRDKRRDEIKE